MPEQPLIVALGGNALKTMSASAELAGLGAACEALAELAADGLVVTHGSGAQLGTLTGNDDSGAPVSLDVLDAEVEGWLGYFIEQELDNWLSDEGSVATLVTRVEVNEDDPAFRHPTKPVGAWMSEAAAKRLRGSQGWRFLVENGRYRRLVPSPQPQHIVQLKVIVDLLNAGHTVICAGGGGIPVIRNPEGRLQGIGAVIDKDLTSALLACRLKARHLIMATDVPGIYEDWPDPCSQPIKSISCRDLAAMQLPPGTMGPKAEAAIRFANATGNNAVIGALDDLPLLLQQQAGTVVVP